MTDPINTPRTHAYSKTALLTDIHCTPRPTSSGGTNATVAPDSSTTPTEPDSTTTPTTTAPASTPSGRGGGTNSSNPFADESGGVAEHASPPEAANPSDPFASPQATPDPLYSDGPQVDGPTARSDHGGIGHCFWF